MDPIEIERKFVCDKSASQDIWDFMEELHDVAYIQQFITASGTRFRHTAHDFAMLLEVRKTHELGFFMCFTNPEIRAWDADRSASSLPSEYERTVKELTPDPLVRIENNTLITPWQYADAYHKYVCLDKRPYVEKIRTTFVDKHQQTWIMDEYLNPNNHELLVFEFEGKSVEQVQNIIVPSMFVDVTTVPGYDNVTMGGKTLEEF